MTEQSDKNKTVQINENETNKRNSTYIDEEKNIDINSENTIKNLKTNHINKKQQKNKNNTTMNSLTNSLLSNPDSLNIVIYNILFLNNKVKRKQ